LYPKVPSEFYRPQMSAAGLSPIHQIAAFDQSGSPIGVWIPEEAPLTIKVDNNEIVMKSAYMRIPVLRSRSGVTQMGLELARDLGITVIGRAKGKRRFTYSGSDNIIFDSRPKSEVTA